MLSLTHVHSFFMYSHLIAGFVTLIVFWVPIFSPKGSWVHIRSGRIFVFSGGYVALTAVLGSLWALLAPMNFYQTRGLSVAAAQQEAEHLEFLFATLLFLGLSILSDLWLGVRLIRMKDAPQRLAAPAIKGMYWLCLLVALWLLCFGLLRLAGPNSGGGYILCVVVGAIGILSTPSTIKFLRDPAPTPHQWLYKHIECMIGCSIGFHIAFFLFGLPRIIVAEWLAGPFVLAVILIPFAVGLPAIRLFIRAHKRKFGEL